MAVIFTVSIEISGAPFLLDRNVTVEFICSACGRSSSPTLAFNRRFLSSRYWSSANPADIRILLCPCMTFSPTEFIWLRICTCWFEPVFSPICSILNTRGACPPVFERQLQQMQLLYDHALPGHIVGLRSQSQFAEIQQRANFVVPPICRLGCSSCTELRMYSLKFPSQCLRLAFWYALGSEPVKKCWATRPNFQYLSDDCRGVRVWKNNDTCGSTVLNSHTTTLTAQFWSEEQPVRKNCKKVSAWLRVWMEENSKQKWLTELSIAVTRMTNQQRDGNVLRSRSNASHQEAIGSRCCPRNLRGRLLNLTAGESEEHRRHWSPWAPVWTIEFLESNRNWSGNETLDWRGVDVFSQRAPGERLVAPWLFEWFPRTQNQSMPGESLGRIWSNPVKRCVCVCSKTTRTVSITANLLCCCERDRAQYRINTDRRARASMTVRMWRMVWREWLLNSLFAQWILATSEN